MHNFLRLILNLNRSLLVALTFVLLIAVGTLLLMLPAANSNGQWRPVLDALFTATSASCVTGLSVLDVGRELTLFGQLVLLVLIQIGGIGIMTITTLVSIGMKKRLNIRQRLLIQEALNQQGPSGVLRVAMDVVRFTFAIELLFGTILACCFYQDLGLKGVYWGYWHAVSAFCNAGFDLLGNFTSLMPYQTNVPVNLCLMLLIVLGGLGFTVIGDVLRSRRWRSFSLHTKLVLTVNAALVAGGALLLWLLERHNPATLGHLGTGDQFLAALFQSITLRTAGFNTIDIAAVSGASLFLMMALMFIGASSTSTGGGIKTTTFAVLMASTYALLRDKKDVVLFNRRIEPATISKSMSVFLLALLWAVLAVFLLLALDDRSHPFQFVMCEVFSALGTVGLGVGITTEWNSWCKLVLIVTMFVGRIGILTFSMSFFNKKLDKLRYPTENILIG